MLHACFLCHGMRVSPVSLPDTLSVTESVCLTPPVAVPSHSSLATCAAPLVSVRAGVSVLRSDVARAVRAAGRVATERRPARSPHCRSHRHWMFIYDMRQSADLEPTPL